jgi:hypothetical protein
VANNIKRIKGLPIGAFPLLPKKLLKNPNNGVEVD